MTTNDDRKRFYRVGDPGELSTDLAHVADLELQRAGFTICKALTDGRLVAVLDLLGPEWLDLLGRLDDVLARYGGTVADVVSDPDRWCAVRNMVRLGDE